MKKLALLIATTGGLGYARIAPGTVGSAAGVAIYLLTSHWSLPAQLGLAAGVSAIGVWAADVAAVHFGRADPSHVVIDEVAGQLVTYLGTGVGWKGAIIGFLLFRGLDIVKPWPIREIDHGMRGGAGIMLDDVLAGILAASVLLLIRYIT